MLPDIALPILVAGRRKRLIARDVPAAVFFDGFPNAVPLADCWRAETLDAQHRVTIELARWSASLLTRVVIVPRLSPALVGRLGREGERAAIAYLTAVGFITPAERGGDDTPALVGLSRVAPEPLRNASAIVRLPVGPPAANLRTALRLMAARGRVLPSVLWALPISEWIFNWRVLLQDELLRREAQADARAPFTNDRRLLEAS